MKNKKDLILHAADKLFNAEGYIAPSYERIAQETNVSKMTLYKYFSDKESLIVAVLLQRKCFFISEIQRVTSAVSGTRDKLLAIYTYYQHWFDSAEFNGCMFARAVTEYGAASQLIRDVNNTFKSDMCQLLADILRETLKPEPAERCALLVMILIDGAITAALSPAMTREYPPITLAWSATKTLIFAEGGEF